MFLKPDNMYPIPDLTIKVANASFPKGDNMYMKIRDEYGAIYTDKAFADLHHWLLANFFGNSTNFMET